MNYKFVFEGKNLDKTWSEIESYWKGERVSFSSHPFNENVAIDRLWLIKKSYKGFVDYRLVISYERQVKADGDNG